MKVKMPNKNYLRGRRFEYYVKDMYERSGYHCTRGAGSHGVDIVAIDWEEKQIKLISCKIQKPSEPNLDKLRKGKFTVTECAVWKVRKGKPTVWLRGHQGNAWSGRGFELRQGTKRI